MESAATSLDYPTLLAVFKDNVSVVNTLWGIFHIVALALLGFVYKEEYLRNSWLALLGFSVGFFIFAVGNQQAMLRSEHVLSAVNQQFHSEEILATVQHAGVKPVLTAHEAREEADVRFGHYVYTFLVLGALWTPFIAGRLRRVKNGKQVT